MANGINRVTLFKVPSPEGQQKLIEAFKEMQTGSKKDGKPYILSLSVGQAADDPRSQGWTVVAQTKFASLDDMRYYDEQDEAHAALREKAKGYGIAGGPAGVLTVYFEASVSSGGPEFAF
ncbi:hypothetical protein DL765_001558 [Monosporascus sp. GIB2]|nr:hypothetical protein DL765_001558 [Monosporascus sp. GIB2]